MNSAGWSKTLTKVSYAKIGSIRVVRELLRLGIIKKIVQADKKWIRKKGESYKANTEQGTVRYCERSQTIQREQGGARETQKVSTRIQKKK